MEALGENLGIMLVIFFLSFVTESTVEYVLGTPLDKVEKLKPWKWVLMYVSAAGGVGLAWYFQTDLIYLLSEVAEAGIDKSPVGYVLTGLMIGRGANFLHQTVSNYFPGKR